MWLQNLCVFVGSEAFAWSAAQLDARLAAAQCPACGQQSAGVEGFVAPVKGHDAMVYMVDGLAVCAHQQIQRVLPAAVLAEAVDERVAAIEQRQARSVGRRERGDIADQVRFELLPRAFTQARRTHVILDCRDNRVWVDCASEKRAEQIVATLRAALASLPVTRPTPRTAPAARMTAWLGADNAGLPHGFELGDRATLESADAAKSSVRVNAMDLQRDEVRAHLASGMRAVRLNLAVDDAIEFDLDDRLDLKRIRALDLVRDDIDALDADDAVAELQARLAIQGPVLRGVLDRLYTHFGVAGEAARAA